MPDDKIDFSSLNNLFKDIYADHYSYLIGPLYGEHYRAHKTHNITKYTCVSSDYGWCIDCKKKFKSNYSNK